MKISGGYKVIPITKALKRACNSNDDATLNYSNDLEINGIFLCDEKQRILILSVDTLFIGNDFRNQIETALRPSLKPEEILIAASHTHSAPMLDSHKPSIAVVDEEFFAEVLQITLKLANELIGQDGHRSFQYRVTRYESRAGINRRKYRVIGGAEKRLKLNQVFQIPNSKKNTPQPSYILEFFTSEAKSFFIWNLPCHPNSIPNELGHSSGFIGQGRNAIRSVYSKDSAIVFLQGASGDIRPPSLPSHLKSRDLLRKILIGNWFIDFSIKEYDKWISTVLEQLLEQITSMKNLEFVKASSLQVTRQTKLYSEFMKVDNLDRKLSIHIINIDELSIFGFSGELLSAFSNYFDSKDKNGTLVATCIDDSFGYLPDVESISQKGYEVEGFKRHFGIAELKKEGFIRMIQWITKENDRNRRNALREREA